jgi:hypothetical protein
MGERLSVGQSGLLRPAGCDGRGGGAEGAPIALTNAVAQTWVGVNLSQLKASTIAEAIKIVKTLDDAVEAYRRTERLCKAFGISVGTLLR